jgi:hypothetical protein
MTQGADSSHPPLIPAKPLPPDADAFSERVHGLLDGNPKDDATVNQAFAGMDAMFDIIAAGMYSLASMLVGEGEQSIRLVESTVATVDLSATHSSAEARKASRLALCRAAVGVLVRRTPGALDAPVGLEHASTCIGDDDLDAAGAYGDELARMMAGSDRDRVRAWLSSLALEQRVIFVMRAVAGLSSQETARLLAEQGGSGATGWNADAVRELFRQALCSLASQLLHASTTR